MASGAADGYDARMPQPYESPSAPSKSLHRRYRWRRLLQYRLRTLLAFTAIVATWLGLWSNSARRQRDAVAALRKCGALVGYDFEDYGLEKPQHWPAWIVDTVGVDYFANIVHIDAIDANTTDADLIHIESLKYLQSLNLGGTQVSDAGLAYLPGLTRLQRLFLNYTRATDGGLIHVRNLTGLEELNLSGTQVTDNALVHLSGLTGLWSLDLSDTGVTDAGLVHFRGLSGLKELGLSRTEVKDAGLVYLSALTGLQKLWLEGTQVSDAGLAHLQSLEGLQNLYLRDTKVTAAGATRLQQSLPNCAIFFRPRTGRG